MYKKVIFTLLILGIILLSAYEITHITKSAQIVYIDNPILNAGIDYNIEKKQIETVKFQEVTELSGWLGRQVDEGGIENSKVYIIVENNKGLKTYFRTESKNRQDVKSYLEPKKYDGVGFNCLLENRVLSEGIYRIGFCIDDGKKTQFIMSDNYIEIVKKNSRFTEFKSDIYDDDINEVSKNVDFNIEEMKNNERLFVKGWARSSDINFTDTNIELVLRLKNGKIIRYTSHEYPRPDIVKHFNDPMSINSGFIVDADSIDMSLVVQIGIMITKDGEDFVNWK